MAEDEDIGEGNNESDTQGMAAGDATQDMGFDDLASGQKKAPDLAKKEDGQVRAATELEPVYDVPVMVQAVLGKSRLEISQLLKLAPGAVVELDRKVGEAIDIYVNNRLVARGEVVLVEEHLGVTMTEIVKTDASN